MIPSQLRTDALVDRVRSEDPESLFQRAPCGYLTTTPDGVVARVNDTFLEWTGHHRDDLVGKVRFSSLLSPGGRIYHDTHYVPILRLQGHARELAMEIVSADGRRIPVLVNAVLGRDDAGEPHVIRVVVLDATERREYERELLRSKQRAEESEHRARMLAHTLQQTLMPPSTPDIPGLELHAVYRPAGTGEEVGGDFYDVFQVGEDDWVVTLGDVCGKGVEAAVVTSLVRHTLRAVTVRTANPAHVLHELNDVLQHHPTDRFCTVALLRLRRHTDGWRLTLSLGGHPNPLLLQAGERALSLGEPGSLVGPLAEPYFAGTQHELAPGATVVLFTDGVTEARRGQEQYGDQRLREIAERHHGSAVAEVVLADVLEFQNGSPRDDIAMVTITVPE